MTMDRRSDRDWIATDCGKVIPVMDGAHIVRTWVETSMTGHRRRYSIDAETARMTMDRRSGTDTNKAVYHAESGKWYVVGTICGRIVTSWGSSAAEAEQRLIDWTRYVIVKVED